MHRIFTHFAQLLASLAVATIPVLTLINPTHASEMEVVATAYTSSDPSQAPYGNKNALGTRLRYGTITSAAADWSRLPVGTQFQVHGSDRIYEVDDYGSAMVGRWKIDLFRPSKSMVRTWGKRTVGITVIRWGSFERSLAILKPRAKKSAHVRRMVTALQERLAD